MSEAAARIDVEPPNGLADEPLEIRVSGLRAGQSVHLRSRGEFPGGARWGSQASFRADAETLDLAKAVPEAGSYRVADPMGLVWSMEVEEPGEVPQGPFIQLAEPWSLEITGEVDGQPLATARVTRHYAAPGVEREEVRERGLVASLFRPGQPGRYPVAIMLSGSAGGLSELRPALLASRGYVGVGLAYFGVESLPRGLVEIPLEYFERAYRWLCEQPFVDPERVAVMGASRGGELALLLGATFPWVRAVVAYVPSGVLHSGIAPPDPEAAGPPPVRAAWTYSDKPLPFAGFDPSKVDYQAREIALTPGFLGGLEDHAAVERAGIAIEQTNGPILFISAADDLMWPSSLFSELAVRRLERCGFGHPFRHLCYEGAGHTIGTPYLPTTVLAAPHPVVPQNFAFGGSAHANALATEDSWRQVKLFLREAFGAK